MKKQLLIIIATLLSVSTFLMGCEKTKEVKESYDYSNEETGFYNILSEEQKKYLSEECQLTNEDEINDLTYEGLNWWLLGTGLELYNQSSGVEKYGVYYTYDESVPKEMYGDYYRTLDSTSNKEITLLEACSIRDKEKDARLEDYLQYKYVITEGDKGSNMFSFPLSDYKDCSIMVKAVENEDGTVHLATQYIKNSSSSFSLKYDLESFDIFVNEEPKYTIDGKCYITTQYTSVTPKSLVIKIDNLTDSKYTIDDSYKLYQYENDTYKELKDYAYESEYVYKVESNRSWTYPVVFANDETTLSPGKYKLVFGKDKENYVYKEIFFEIN